MIKVDGSFNSIQPAIDYAEANSKGEVYLGAGVYTVSSPILLPSRVSLIGAGRYTTELRTTSTTEYLIEVGDGTNNPNDNVLRDFAFRADNFQTSGGGIRVRNGHSIGLERLREDSPNLRISVDLQGGPQQSFYKIEKCEFNGGHLAAVRAGGQSVSGQTFIRGFNMSNTSIGGVTGSIGILLEGVSSFTFDSIEILKRLHAIKIDTGLDRRVDFGAAFAVKCDSSEDHGMVYEGLGSISELEWTNCWSSTSGFVSGTACGVLFNAPGINIVKYLGGQFINNKSHAFDILAGKNIMIGGTSISYNNRAQLGSSGIHAASGVNEFQILNNRIGESGPFVGITPESQLYGVDIDIGPSNDFMVFGNDLRKNATASIRDGSTGLNKILTPNLI